MIHEKAKIFESAKIVGDIEPMIGAYSQIDDFVFINTGKGCEIGNFTHIASFSSVIGGGNFVMMDFSGLSSGCRILTGTDDFSGGFLTNPTVPDDLGHVQVSEVMIEKHAVLGANVIVFPGVRIGEGAAVGAGCVVRKDIEPWTIYAGFNPRPVGRRDKHAVLEKERLVRQRFPDVWSS